MQFVSAGFMAYSALSMESDKTFVTGEAGPHSIPIKINMFFSILFSPNNFLVSESYSHIYHVSVLPNVEVTSLHSACPAQCYVTLMHP